MKLVKNENEKKVDKVTDEEAREAFVKILKWIIETPSLPLKLIEENEAYSKVQLHDKTEGCQIIQNNHPIGIGF